MRVALESPQFDKDTIDALELSTKRWFPTMSMWDASRAVHDAMLGESDDQFHANWRTQQVF